MTGEMKFKIWLAMRVGREFISVIKYDKSDISLKLFVHFGRRANWVTISFKVDRKISHSTFFSRNFTVSFKL